MPDDGGGWQNDAAGGCGNDSSGDAGQAAGKGGPLWDAEEPSPQLQWQSEAGAASPGAEPAAATAEDGSQNGWVDEEEAEQPGEEPQQQQQQQQQSPVIRKAGLPVVYAPPLAAGKHHAQGRSSSKAARQLPVHQGESSEGSSQPRQSGSQALRGKQQQRTVVKAAAAADDAASTRSTAMGLQLPVAAPRTVTKPAAASSPQPAGVQAGLGLPGVPELEPLDPELLKAAPTLADVLLANPAADAGLPLLHTHAGGAAAAAGWAADVGALPVALPAQPARPQRQAASVAAPHAAAAGDSDEDMPSFGLLGDLSPPKPRQAGPAASMDEPFSYLLHLAARASSAGAHTLMTLLCALPSAAARFPRLAVGEKPAPCIACLQCIARFTGCSSQLLEPGLHRILQALLTSRSAPASWPASRLLWASCSSATSRQGHPRCGRQQL